MNIQTVFFNNFNRLRSGWRFAIFVLLVLFFALLFQIISLSLIGGLPLGQTTYGFLSIAVASFTSLAAALTAGWIAGRFLESLPFRALGAWFTENWLKDLTLGLIFGAAAVSLAVLIAAIFGGLRFSVNNTASGNEIFASLGISFVIFGFAAAYEEALFRGYMLQTFTRAGLQWFAVAMTSIFFGLVHLGNPDANFISTANTMIAGVLFSAAYLKTRTLWFAFGLHFFWNWMQGSFFGIEVSGMTEISNAPLLLEIDHGPAWLTGAGYGIEGGIACTISLILFTAFIWFAPFLKASDEMLEFTEHEIPHEST